MRQELHEIFQRQAAAISDVGYSWIPHELAEPHQGDGLHRGYATIKPGPPTGPPPVIAWPADIAAMTVRTDEVLDAIAARVQQTAVTVDYLALESSRRGGRKNTPDERHSDSSAPSSSDELVPHKTGTGVFSPVCEEK